ncbi:MAG: VanZ family protein [Luteimonas sp.]|nr:VanZ family protein [Luteimonas sp.]
MTGYRPGRSLKPFAHPWLWSGLWCLGIAALVVLSLMPGPPMPDFEDSDKLGHFLAYFALAAGAVQLFARWSSLLGAGVGLVLLGVGMEYAQGAFTDYRMLDARDALANTIGVIAGLGTRLTPLRDLLLRLDRGRRQS